MKALWHLNAKTSLINASKDPAIVGAVSLSAHYSLISCGTEGMVASGKVSNDFYEHMKVPHMEGDFNLPIKYGYSLVGKTNDGRSAHIMHPHQDRINIDPSALFYFDEKLPIKRACLISNMETVINAIWDSEPSKNDRIAVCGFGGIGALLANTLKVHYGFEVDVIETNEWRNEKAKALGFNLAVKPLYDIIYHTSATQAGLQYSIDHLGEEGKVIELSWYGDRSVQLSLGKEFHYKRLQIISSQVSVIPKRMRAIHNYITRKELAVKYLLDNSYDDLISAIIPFEDSPAFFNKLRTGEQGDGLIWLIQY